MTETERRIREFVDNFLKTKPLDMSLYVNQDDTGAISGLCFVGGEKSRHALLDNILQPYRISMEDVKTILRVPQSERHILVHEAKIIAAKQLVASLEQQREKVHTLIHN